MLKKDSRSLHVIVSSAGRSRQGAQQYDQAKAEGESWEMGGPTAPGTNKQCIDCAAPKRQALRLQEASCAGTKSCRLWRASPCSLCYDYICIYSLLLQVRPMAEDEMFKVLKSGKRMKKSWKRMVTKVCWPTHAGQRYSLWPAPATESYYHVRTIYRAAVQQAGSQCTCHNKAVVAWQGRA